MGGPGWLTDTFAAIMIAVAAYNASRLVAALRWRRPAELDADGVHVAMGTAMAGMLVPRLSFAPAGLWEAVFAVAAAWFGWQFVRTRRGAAPGSWRCPHPLPHLIECGAMVFMLLIPAAAAAGALTSGMGGGMSAAASRFSPLTLLLALFMFGYVMWLGNGLTALHEAVPALAVPEPPGHAPGHAPDHAAGSSGEVPGAAAVAARGGGGTAAGGPYLAPRCVACCKIAMGITMGYMLILML
jgi:hypothetical protein